MARIDHHTGRQEVKALLRLERQHMGEHHLLRGGQAVLSIPDKDVIVKRLTVNGEDDIEMRARFELAQILPYGETDYFFDIADSGLEDRLIGMAVRKTRLNDYINALLGQQKETLPDTDYLMRSAALANGYTEFCRRFGGDLLCLADLTESAVSLAFLYQNKMVDLCHLPLGKFDLAAPVGFEKMAMELKTLVNFKTSSLFSEGVTTPLSGLVISGDRVSDDLIEKLQKYFAIDISRPAINSGFFSSQADLASVPLEKYLVALGLAAN